MNSTHHRRRGLPAPLTGFPIRRAIFGLLCATATILPVRPAAASHPYYQDLLRRGAAALESGDPESAARSLRLAAFGLLEEPPELAGCLVRLALAQRAVGDAEATRESLSRVVDLEVRFGAYSASGLDPGLAESFESLLVESVAAETLRSIPAFRDAAHQRVVQEIEGLPRRQRGERLDQLLVAEPDEPQWPLMLARLEHAAGRFDRAIGLVDRVLALTPEDPSAFCVRGLAHAGAGDCSAAVVDLQRCDRTTLDASIAWTHLDCLVTDARWVESAAFLDALAPALKSEKRMRKLERKVERNRPEVPPATAALPAPEAGPQPMPGEAPSGDPPAAASAAPSLPAADAARLTQARQQLGQARTVNDLAEASALAMDVADRHPQAREAQLLAAEIAYRSSRWSEAASYFRRANVSSSERPELLFYFAVALWESGEPAAAAATLEPALQRLRRTEFVNGYIAKILGPER